MPFIQRSLFCFVLCLFLPNYERVTCEYREISTREAKSLLETPRNPGVSYQATNDFPPVYPRKDQDLADSEGRIEEGKQDVEENQILWSEGGRRAEILAVTSTEDSADVGRDRKISFSDLGETEKIITVRISSSVARSTYLAGKPNYQEKPKLAALQRIGFNVEEPASKMSASPYVASDFRFRGFLAPPYTERNLPREIWLRQTTEKPVANNSEGKYYETRIETVSSRKQIVFGKSDSKGAADAAPARLDYDYYREPRKQFCELPEGNYELPEKNYEVDESVSLVTDGQNAGVVEGPITAEGSKLGYVMEGRNFRKYRVEERTPDGFIVGEYGFVRHEDGKLHGVRYTADVTANPRLIYDALMKFLSL